MLSVVDRWSLLVVLSCWRLLNVVNWLVVVAWHVLLVACCLVVDV